MTSSRLTLPRSPPRRVSCCPANLQPLHVPTCSPVCPTCSPVCPTCSPVCPTCSPVCPNVYPVCPTCSPVCPNVYPVCSTCSPVCPGGVSLPATDDGCAAVDCGRHGRCASSFRKAAPAPAAPNTLFTGCPPLQLPRGTMCVLGGGWQGGGGWATMLSRGARAARHTTPRCGRRLSFGR